LDLFTTASMPMSTRPTFMMLSFTKVTVTFVNGVLLWGGVKLWQHKRWFFIHFDFHEYDTTNKTYGIPLWLTILDHKMKRKKKKNKAKKENETEKSKRWTKGPPNCEKMGGGHLQLRLNGTRESNGIRIEVGGFGLDPVKARVLKGWKNWSEVYAVLHFLIIIFSLSLSIYHWERKGKKRVELLGRRTLLSLFPGSWKHLGLQ
jgi:hypothetical protein